MIQNEKFKGHPNYPLDVCFEYEQTSYIPIASVDSDGKPYTGKAHGTHGIADWSGAYIEGLCHGEFRIVLGDRSGGSCMFKHGERVD